MYLLDINLLLALAWPNHVMHERAQAWLGVPGKRTWATTDLTETGFVRLCMNPAVVGQPLTWAGSLALIREIRSVAGHELLAGKAALDILESKVFVQAPVAGHRQVADVHLVALAHQHGGVLATLDKGVVQGVHPEHRRLIEVVH